jgi:hypothetical protein
MNAVIRLVSAFNSNVSDLCYVTENIECRCRMVSNMYFVLERCRVQITGWSPAILTEVFHGLCQSYQVNSWVVPQNYATTVSFRILSN